MVDSPVHGPFHGSRQVATAEALLALPAAVLLLFAIGEIAAGDITGVQHIPEAALLLLLCAAALWRPRPIGGVILVIDGVLFVAWLIWLASLREAPATDAPLPVWIASAFILFGPPAVAGWLLYRSRAG